MVSKNSKIFYPIFRYSSLVLFLAISAISAQANQILIPVYDRDYDQIRIFKIWEPLMLVCKVNATVNYELQWFKNNVPIKEAVPTRSKIFPAENRLMVEKTLDGDAGKYTCSVEIDGTPYTANFNVIASPIAKLPKSVPVVEEETLTITCIAVGTDPEFSWKIGNETYTESRDRVVLSEDEAGHKNAVLSYKKATLDDRGNFTCEVRNIATNITKSVASATTYVRVKGKLAALWPFIGICAEVFVLCAIILIYEKRRNKQEAEESDTDSPELKNDLQGKDSDVRQRK